MIKQVSNNVLNLGIKDRLTELVQLCFIKTNVHEDANTLFQEGTNLILLKKDQQSDSTKKQPETDNIKYQSM